MAWQPNLGKLPPHAVGRRVSVRLRGGYTTVGNPNEPSGWAADGKAGCCWAIVNSQFDILEWELT